MPMAPFLDSIPALPGITDYGLGGALGLVSFLYWRERSWSRQDEVSAREQNIKERDAAEQLAHAKIEQLRADIAESRHALSASLELAQILRTLIEVTASTGGHVPADNGDDRARTA